VWHTTAYRRNGAESVSGVQLARFGGAFWMTFKTNDILHGVRSYANSSASSMGSWVGGAIDTDYPIVDPPTFHYVPEASTETAVIWTRNNPD
jgi:hypothetical protein